MRERLVATISSLFAILALLLTCLGLYGLMSYAVTRRISEIGIRMALGARKWHVLGMVLQETLMLIGAGIAIGVPAALGTARFTRTLLFRTEPADPAILALVGMLLALVAAIAGYRPAARAARVDPAVALRCE